MNIKEHTALKIVKKLSTQGFEALYAGGYVRDMILGRSDKSDIDIATSAYPSHIKAIFRNVVAVGEHFGVMIVVENGIAFEVATFRSDQGVADGRHPQKISFCDARTDALRRDFTINGLFYNPLTRKIIDYIDGKKDLKYRLIRAIGDPIQRFEEDYLRLLRAIRFAAAFSFTIEDSTWNAIKLKAEGILKISKERIFQELDKILSNPNADKALRLLYESGILHYILPEVEAMSGIEQPAAYHPEGDVLQHTIKALSLLRQPSQILAWSTLLHDVGKPQTMKKSKDRIRFNNHNRVGALIAEQILQRLKAPKALITAVCFIIDNHMNFINVTKMRLAKLKKFIAAQWFNDELELHRIDCVASHGNLDNYYYLLQKLNELAKSALLPTPFIRGQDLIELGLRPGPSFKIILNAAYDLQLEEKLKSRQQALKWIKKNLEKYKKLSDNTLKSPHLKACVGKKG